MGIEIDIAGKYIALLVVFTVAVVAAGAFIVDAQEPIKLHSYQEIELPTVIWPGLIAENVPIEGIIDRPIIITGMCEESYHYPSASKACGGECINGFGYDCGAGAPSHSIENAGTATCKDLATASLNENLCECPGTNFFWFDLRSSDWLGYRHNIWICYI